MLHSRYVIIVIISWSLVTNEAVVRNEDICGVQNGRRLYLELGEQGILYAKNVSFIKNSPRLQDSRIYTTNSSHDQCSLELVTCPSCVITLTFKSIALSQNCGDGSFMLDSTCRCDYVWISEPPYEDISGTPFCGFYSPISYRSNTRTLSITLLYSQSHNHAFTLEYTSERNRIHLKGSDISTGIGKSRNSTIGGILTSPFFPSRYPRDLGMEYVITCPAEAPSCRVRVLFSDFQLAAVSIIEFYDWNGQRLDVSSGVRFRPPVIVSSGPSLLIRFYANGGTGLGYKAFYSFVLGHLYDKSVQPITDCGGYVENLGGAITMMDMVDEGIKIYDCVWLIRPPKTFLHMKTHIYLKIIIFDDMAGSTELIIKQGPTSALLPLEILRHPASKLQPRRLKEHIAPISSGFHVSLRGTFGPTSHLAMAYATFSYTDCFTGSDFLCQNHRCIPSQLNCDGFDHCGDNSDEPSTCTRDWELASQDRKWHTNKANYYFPKIDHYPDLKTATFVFVASSLGLITLISALIVLLYRMGARARQQRELQTRLQTISELLDGARIEEVNVSDDPPGYESPPGYDEVVKLSLECENKKRKQKKFNNSNCRTSSRITNHYPTDNEANASDSILVDDGASTSDSYHCVPTNDSSVQQTVPESPPPPYMTPPGTIAQKIDFLGFSNPPECTADSFSDQEERCVQLLESTTGENSKSLPVSEAATPVCLTSTTDAELLGAYLQNYGENQTENSTSQLSSWRDASTIINPEFETRSKDAEIVKDVSEDKRTKNCSCGDVCGCAIDDHDKRTSPSSSSFIVLEVGSKKTAKPRSRRKGEGKVLTSTSSPTVLSNTSTTIVVKDKEISLSSPSTILSTTQEFPIVTASSTLESRSPSSLNVTPSTQVSSNSTTEASTTQLVIISTTSAVTVSTKTSPIPLEKPSSTHSVKVSSTPRVKSSLICSANAPSTSVLPSSEKTLSSFTGIAPIRSKVKISPIFSTISSSISDANFLPKTSSTPVEIHYKKSSSTPSVKYTLTSCAITSASFELTQPVKSLSASSISDFSATALTYSEKSLPIPSAKISPIPSTNASSTSSVKASSTSSVKASSCSSVKASSTSAVKVSPSSSGKTLSTALFNDPSSAMINNSSKSSTTSAGKPLSAHKVKPSTIRSVKISSTSSVKESSLPTVTSSSISSGSFSNVVSSPTSSVTATDTGPSTLSILSTLETNRKSAIVKIFGNSKIATKSPLKMSLNLGNYSTASSSSASTNGKSFMRSNLSRKFSICSHDSYATKLSAPSASSSYEKLHDDFEILSECSSMSDSNGQTNTSFNTPKFKQERTLSIARPYADQCKNCDLESLYEGIRILDSFMAKREKNKNCTKNSSRIATLFGTPKHSSKRVRKNYHSIERKRFWRSADDATIIEVSYK